jgi:hypothetical protein
VKNIFRNNKIEAEERNLTKKKDLKIIRGIMTGSRNRIKI